MNYVSLCDGNGLQPLIAETLTANCRNYAKAGNNRGVVNPIIERKGVRRLTPLECERLMGMPDDYTLVPYKGKPMKDSPRYRMIGNSIAVPVLRLIAEAIQQSE